jgi:hypothetical protein
VSASNGAHRPPDAHGFPSDDAALDWVIDFCNGVINRSPALIANQDRKAADAVSGLRFMAGGLIALLGLSGAKPDPRWLVLILPALAMVLAIALYHASVRSRGVNGGDDLGSLLSPTALASRKSADDLLGELLHMPKRRSAKEHCKQAIAVNRIHVDRARCTNHLHVVVEVAWILSIGALFVIIWPR